MISNCSLVLNGRINKTNYTITKGVSNNITATNLEENKYEWTINCTDSVGNTGTNDTLRVLYVDFTAPNITFITNNGTWYSDPTPDIYFNITDNFDSVLNYTVYADGVLENLSYC